MSYTALTLAGLTTAVIIPSDDLACSEDIVRNAASQGFVRSIFNCVRDQTTSPGAQACLAAFIADNATDNAYPISGTCRAEYQTLVDAMWVGADDIECPSVYPTDDPLSDECADHLIAGFRDFYLATGFYSQEMCTAAQVRAYAAHDAFKFILAFGWVVDGADYEDETFWDGTVCNVCYDKFYEDIGSAPTGLGNEGLVDECTDVDGPTDTCLASSIMIDARSNFVACAGWDILFEGPVCTPEGVATVQTLIPTPYYTFAQCAYHPSTSFCKTIQSYFDAIEADTNSVDCLACYTELRDAINTAATSDEGAVACGDDVFADDCVAYQNEALMAFETCAGTIINTDSSTAAPVTTTTAATTTTTTTEAATTVAETTTKSAIASTSVAGLIVIAVVSSLAL